MLSPHDIHHGILLPIFLSAFFLLPAFIPKLRPHSRIFLLISLTIAFIFPHLHLFGRPPLPPIDSTEWLFYLPLPTLAFALLIHFTNLRSLALPLLFLSTTLILWPILRNENDFAQSATIITAIALLSFLAYLSLTELSPRIGSRSMHLILLLILAATSQIIFMSATQKLGQISLILASALFGSLLLTWPLKIPLTAGPLLFILLLWHSLLISAYFAATLTLTNLVLLAVAPHLASLSESPKTRLWPTPIRLILRFAVVFLPMFTAQLLALLTHLESMRAFEM